MKLDELLKYLSESHGVSGYEQETAAIIREYFKPLVDEIRTDKLGNLISYKKGTGKIKVMLAAHMDEIGLMVTKIEKGGFLRFTSVGGVDPRNLIGQEVIVSGREKLTGIVGAKPPHLQAPDEQKKSVPMDKLFIDVGLSEERARELISVGDIITIKQDFISLKGQKYAGKALDDRAGVGVVFSCLQELQYLKHKADVFGVTTVQEEVGLRGAFTSTYGIVPDIGIAIDVCFGAMPGVPEDATSELGEGPALGFGPHVHPRIFKKLKELCEELDISYQLEPSPYPGGTDAFAIQITRGGIPTVLVSIPLKYMHTPVETVDLSDIKKAGRLLAHFITSVDEEFVEGLKCF